MSSVNAIGFDQADYNQAFKIQLTKTQVHMQTVI